jgi:hypothetical protein
VSRFPSCLRTDESGNQAIWQKIEEADYQPHRLLVWIINVTDTVGVFSRVFMYTACLNTLSISK